MEATAELVCPDSAMEEDREEADSSPVCSRRAPSQEEAPWKRSWVYLQCCE